MSWAQRVNDAFYRFYGRILSSKAVDAAKAPLSGSIEDLRGRKTCLLVTTRRDGSAALTPLWFGLDSGRVYVRTGAATTKVKRLRRNPNLRVAACAANGRPLSAPFAGHTRVLAPEEERRAEEWIQANFSLGRAVYMRAIAFRVPAVYIEITPTSSDAN